MAIAARKRMDADRVSAPGRERTADAQSMGGAEAERHGKHGARAAGKKAGNRQPLVAARRRLFRLRTFLGDLFYRVGSRGGVSAWYWPDGRCRMAAAVSGRCMARLLAPMVQAERPGLHEAVRGPGGAGAPRAQRRVPYPELVADERKNGACACPGRWGCGILLAGCGRTAIWERICSIICCRWAAGAVFVLTVVHVLGSQFALRGGVSRPGRGICRSGVGL